MMNREVELRTGVINRLEKCFIGEKVNRFKVVTLYENFYYMCGDM